MKEPKMPEKFNFDTNYCCNPDVVLREEDEVGGLLFNPDTNQVKVVNTSGLFIWKQFATMNRCEKVLDAVLKEFEEADAEQAKCDLEEFVEHLLNSGFLGEVEVL